jgi:phytanoyl-CoA hydroxylase
MITSVTTGLRDSQLAHFEKNGFIILRDVFSAGECDAYRERMTRLARNEETLEGFRIQENYRRSFNQHLYDPSCETWMIDARLQRPLEDILGGKVEAIQTMHFFIGSEHRRHQDQYYLPDCLATWIPFEDVSEENGTIFVEPGSHRRRFVAKHDVPKPDEMDYATHQHDVYFPKVEKVSRDSGVKPVLVEIEKGDVCIFHGRMIHGGVTPTVEGSSRQVLASHYIPHGSDQWDRAWPRISFDGTRRVRYTDANCVLITD